MALFESKESKELKKQARREEVMENLHERKLTKLASFKLDGVDSEYVDSLYSAVMGLSGVGMMELGKQLSLHYKTEDNLKITFLRTLVDQNWVIIRQLDQLNKNIQALTDSQNK